MSYHCRRIGWSHTCLIKVEYVGNTLVEGYCISSTLAELLPGCRRQQGCYYAVSLVGLGTCSTHRIDMVDQVNTGHDVAPLVRTTKLNVTAYILVQSQEVVRLKELVGKLCE